MLMEFVIRYEEIAFHRTISNINIFDIGFSLLSAPRYLPAHLSDHNPRLGPPQPDEGIVGSTKGGEVEVVDRRVRVDESLALEWPGDLGWPLISQNALEAWGLLLLLLVVVVFLVSDFLG